jgi:NADH:ubiquinone oxidoreductase subunit
VGEDRFGNRYYQYFSFFGLPTRREIRFKNEIDFEMKDLVYFSWLHNQVVDPPSED